MRAKGGAAFQNVGRLDEAIDQLRGDPVKPIG
jgi:hypothetical protein